MTNIDEIQAKQIVREMSEEQRQYSQNLFFSMAISDGVFHPKESAIIEQIFGRRDGKRLKEVQNIGRWFFDWDKSKNISYIIEKKEYIPAYQ